MSTKTVDLFGGAITASIPAPFQDASDIRPVPSTQEVFISPTHSTSLIIELTTRVDLPDAEAVDLHFEDVANEPGRLHRAFSKEAVRVESLSDKPAYTILGTVSPDRDHHSQLFTALLMTIMRLEEIKTDIVITVNVQFESQEDVQAEGFLSSPSVTAEGNGIPGPLMKEAVAIRDEVLRSFKILDYGLFVPE
ncbi:hypothetical protein RUND412_002182 [Rhizina undulata]